MSTPQEYWDACLIRGFRQFNTVLDTVVMYKSITGESPNGLLRVPPMHYNKSGIRIFVASRLPKINDWLHDHEPAQDVALLRKLKNSKYDITASNANPDVELSKERSQYIRNRKKIAMDSLNNSNRNQATDWGVTKGPAKIQRRR